MASDMYSKERDIRWSCKETGSNADTVNSPCRYFRVALYPQDYIGAPQTLSVLSTVCIQVSRVTRPILALDSHEEYKTVGATQLKGYQESTR
ncbi:hypothetical protein Taro_006518 [Colocasia esculenta]|uniref:Uncharacterized protein n=1 Tax=Colocasia esculenta TaxID=4460 RepID=A0A843TX95_COLES|nr:hypothetical protein [Colocasia esculenta]